MPIVACLFTSYSLPAFAGVQLLAWILPLLLSFFARYRDPRPPYRWVAEFFLVCFSWYLFIVQLLLYILQISMQQLQADPFCPGLMDYSFPAFAPFWIGICITLTAVLPWTMGFRYGFLNAMTILTFIWITPAAVLIWFSFFTWQQVLLSAGIGVLITLIFVFIMITYMVPLMPFILTQAPATWFNLTETWFSTPAQQQYTLTLAQLLKRTPGGI